MHWKSLLSAFVSVGRLILRLFAFIWSAIRYLVGAVFGVLNWQRPAWLGFITSSLRSYWQWCRSHPRHMTTSIGWIMIAVGSFLWYQSLPKPVTVSFSVDAPGLTVFENQQWRIANLDIYFEDSVAPLANIDTVITSGVSMSPKIDGEWRWLSGRQLRFIPRTDWQIAQTYKIRFDKSKWLADNTVLNTYQAEFTTPEFTTQLESNQFYLDPIDPTQKKMVATFAFSHPVNQSSFEKRLTFKLADGLKFLNKDAAPLSISYDKEKLHAYVHSAALETPREDLAMKLLLDDGVTAERGSNKTDSDIDSSITVPGRSSLRFSDFAMNIVDNERFEPVQLLNFSSSAPMSEKALTGQIRAWLLPEFPSDYKGSRSEPYSWDQEHVSEAILKAAPALPLGYQAGEQEYNDQHGFTFSAPVGRYVYALIPAGVQAFGGYDALKPTGYLFPVKPYPTVLKLMSEGALLTANGSKKIAYVSRGVNAVRYEVGRLLPNQLHHMMADHQNNLATPYVSDDRFNSLVERFTEIQPTPGTDPTKAYIQNIDLNKYLYTKDGRKRGIFVLRIREAERTDKPEDKNYDYGGDGRLIVVTDLGVVAKRTMNGDYDLYVMSLATGKPVEAARVELVGLNGMAVASDNTDSSGHASITMQQNWLREKTPLMFVINKDDDTSFLPLNRDDRNLDFSRFDIGGIENAESGKQLSAYAFTDRNLYRPGETAHLMYIVRTADWQGELQGLPLEVVVTDPRGLVVQRTRIALSRAGFDGLDFVSSAASLTGDYQFTISIIRNNNEHERLGGGSFAVREFEPDRLKVHATLATSDNDGWIKPEDVLAKVQVMHRWPCART